MGYAGGGTAGGYCAGGYCCGGYCGGGYAGAGGGTVSTGAGICANAVASRVKNKPIASQAARNDPRFTPSFVSREQTRSCAAPIGQMGGRFPYYCATCCFAKSTSAVLPDVTEMAVGTVTTFHSIDHARLPLAAICV